MSTDESPRAANTGASKMQCRVSPQGTTNLTNTTTVIAAAERAHYLWLLADVLARTSYRGLGIDHQPVFVEHADPTRRRILPTRRHLRRLVGDHVSDLVVDRFVANLATFARELQHEIDTLVGYTVNQVCATDDNTNDADRRREALQLHLHFDVDRGVRRHPAGRRTRTTGGVR